MEKENANFEKRDLKKELIESERLTLIPIAEEYKDEIFKEFTEDITLYMYPSSPNDISDTEEFINTATKELEQGTDLQMAVLDKDSREFYGCAGLHHIDRKNPEMGIWIKKSAHGNSYGKEAMKAMKKWADENLDYEYLLYPVVDENIASRKIPESLGGKIEREYEQKILSGATHNFIEYRIFPDKK